MRWKIRDLPPNPPYSLSQSQSQSDNSTSGETHRERGRGGGEGGGGGGGGRRRRERECKELSGIHTCTSGEEKDGILGHSSLY